MKTVLLFDIIICNDDLYNKGANIEMKKLIAFLTAAIMILGVCVSAQYSEDDLTDTVDAAVAWKNSHASPYYNSGTEASDLYIFALKRLGIEYDYGRYNNSMKSVLQGYGSNRTAAVYARAILALDACGADTQSYNGRDLVADGSYNKDNISGADDWSWALIALDSRDYSVPDWAVNKRADMVRNIMAAQNADGSIGRNAASTALALIALADYTYEETEYTYTDASGAEKTATAWEAAISAVNYLSQEQSEWGDYYDLKTTALVLIALDAIDADVENDGRFIKDGNTVVDGLLVYTLGDLRFTRDHNDSDSTATSYAILALTSHLRHLQGRAKLFDMTADDTVDGVEKNPNETNPPSESSSSGSSSSGSSSSGSSSSGSSSSVTKPSVSSGSSTKTTAKPKVQSTKRPAATTMKPISSAKPSSSPVPRKKALVGPVEMPGPLQKTPEPMEMPPESEELNTGGSHGSASRPLSIGIAMLALAAVITALGVTYVIRTSKDVPLPRKTNDIYKAKIHRKTEVHERYKKREKYKERGKYKGSYRK